MPCSSAVSDESGNVFRIEGPYDINCNETRMFGYMDKFTIWRADKCCGKHPDWPDSQKLRNHLVELKEYSKYGWCRNWCRASVICTPKEFVNMNRCFWEERLSGVAIYKNDLLINHFSVTLTVCPHLEAPYGFCKHINDVTSKESIYLNTATNNFLEGTNFNYSCTPLNTPICCRQDYIMPEVRTANSMPNIPSCSTLITLETKDIIPITNFCKAIKVIRNIESNSIGIKSLSESCDIQVENKTKYKFYISVNEKCFKFFNDFSKISCDLVMDGSYINCADKEPEDVKPKDQGFDEATEKIVDTSNTVSGRGGLDISFGNMFQSKFKIILIVIIIVVDVSIAVAILIIFLYCYCNRTKVAIAAASVNTC
jgi:hypothetical protein